MTAPSTAERSAYDCRVLVTRHERGVDLRCRDRRVTHPLLDRPQRHTLARAHGPERVAHLTKLARRRDPGRRLSTREPPPKVSRVDVGTVPSHEHELRQRWALPCLL